VVHSVGAWIAWAGAWFVGPRRYFSRRNPGKFPPYLIVLAVLGVIMLWFGWWGFNGGSLLKYDSTIASIILNTNLAGASAGLVAYLQAICTGRENLYGKTIGGTLGGLVAITACCDVATPGWAIFVGATAGVVHNLALVRLPRWFGIDDVAGAIPVHGACGVLGTLLTGFIIWLSHNGSPWQIGAQFLGVGFAIAYVGVMSLGIFGLLHITVGLRVSITEEDGGARGSMLGPYSGKVRISVRRYIKLPVWVQRLVGLLRPSRRPAAIQNLNWTRFIPLEKYAHRIPDRYSTPAAAADYAASKLRDGRWQAIRDDDTEATEADLRQAMATLLAQT